MATLATEMPPLHTAEAGVTTQASLQPPIGSANGGGGVGSGVGQPQQEGIDSTQSPEMEQQNNSTTSMTTATNTNNNNTISAAADSSDNQPSTPQPHIPNGNDSQQQQQQQQQPAAHHPYANHHMYSNSQPTTTANSHLNHLYPQQIYSSSNMDMQQQHQLQQPLTANHHSSAYPSYLNSYEQFYQQQQHQQQQHQQQNPSQHQQSHQSQNPQMDYINSNSNSNSMYSAAEYKQQAGVRYHPYLNTPISVIPSVISQNSNSNNALDSSAQSAPVVSSASSSVMSPRVVSSTSPSSSSNQMQISGSASSIGSMSAGNPSSPAGTPQCKKCGIMCANEAELQEHIANVHGASPYGSSGYASSPYIKEELQQQQTPPSQTQQQQQQPSQQGVSSGGNTGEILDLDSQKMLYPPAPGTMPMMHQSLVNTDPLHGLHSMQQRAGMATWDQQSNEGLPPYLQQQQPTPESKNVSNHSPYYQSPKQSPYHVSNSTNIIKSEYPIIKSEYSDDNQQYMSDKSFDPTAPGSQQMMPPAVSSSPAEFPSTTTGGPQGPQQQSVGSQQFRQGTFEPPTSSSTSVTRGAIGAKAANWKSNEARRPKTYNCTACNKWFTSSGHLKRHYNTTLHKNAVKTTGKEDPADLPISVHHHPARDPSGKATRRANAAAAAAARANAQKQQQQKKMQPNPIQPPEPPNSPHNYGGPQMAAGGMTPLSHYAATPSPNSMYQQQQQYQQQHQYMPQVQSTTITSPQNASNMVGLTPTAHHQQQQQQQQLPSQTQQTVMNGHPNALAGPSVPPTQQQTPMPSSQMRGLLNYATIPTTIHILKTEYMEAADMKDLYPQQDQNLVEEEVAELVHLSKLQTVEEDQQQERSLHSAKGDMESLQGKEDLEEQEGDHREEDPNAVHHHTQPLPQSQHHLHYQLEHHQQQADMERPYHNTTPSSTHSNTSVLSPNIISHQQYQEQLQQQQHQMVEQGICTLTQTPSPPQQQHHHSIMEHQPYINMPHLDINMQQLNNMQQLQPPLITMEQQPPQPDTTIPTTNTVNMLQPSLHMPSQQQLTELQPLLNIPLPDTNTNILHMLQSHISTNNITSIPSYHQLQQPDSVLQPLDHTLTFPHTIIGNTFADPEILTFDTEGGLVPAPGQNEQVLHTSDGQIVHVISTASPEPTTFFSTPTFNTAYLAQRSPPEADSPPMPHHYNGQQTPTITISPSMAYSPTISSSSTNSASTNSEYEINSNYNAEQQELQQEKQMQEILDQQEAQLQQKKVKSRQSTTAANKRKRNPSTSSSIGANSEILPSGRIKCLPCNKEFTKICYLTQHNKSFHSGEYPYRCSKCGKRYQTQEVYDIHVLKHKTIDKAHKCNICPKQFHHKTDLRRHVEAIHTGNKQHCCDICEKSFCRKDHLRKHLETHSRPRVLSKKSLKAKSTTTTVGEIESKDNSINTLIEQQSFSPIITSQIILTPAFHFNETNSLSSVTTSTPSPILQHFDYVAIDDNVKLEDEYNANETDEEPTYLTMQEYQEHIQEQEQLQFQNSAQYVLTKNVYELMEQDLPIY